MDKIEFNLRLKRSGMTRAEAAENLGVSLDTVVAYCKGKRSVPPEKVKGVQGWPEHLPKVADMGDKSPVVSPIGGGTGGTGVSPIPFSDVLDGDKWPSPPLRVCKAKAAHTGWHVARSRGVCYPAHGSSDGTLTIWPPCADEVQAQKVAAYLGGLGSYECDADGHYAVGEENDWFCDFCAACLHRDENG